MTYTVISIKTKPDGVVFWNQVSEENAQSALQFEEWITSLPGFITRTREDIDENTRKTTTVWDSHESFLSFQDLKKSQKNKIDSIEYNDYNDIITSNTVEINH